MKITYDLDLYNFEAWSGGETTLDRIIAEDKVGTFEFILEELYPDGMSETELNDILRFEDEWVYEVCGIRSESVIREELEEAQEELAELMENYANDIDDEELTNEEKEEIWESYKDEIEEAQDKVNELEEELENF